MRVQGQRLAEALRSEGIDIDLIPVDCPSWADHYPLLRTIQHFRNRQRRLRSALTSLDGLIVFSCSGISLRLVTAPAVRLCNKLSVPVVISDRGGDTDDWLAESSSVRRLYRSLAEKCKAVHVSSAYLERVFRNYGIATQAVPILIELEKIPYCPRPAKPGLILNNRTMSRFHDVQLSIRVFAELKKRHPEIRMIVTGDGCESRACKRLASDFGIEGSVEFSGPVTNSDVIELLAKSDLLLNTSRHDNIPNAILEGFASGIPVITSDAGGIPDLVGEEKRGYLVHERSEHAFVSAIHNACTHPDETLAKIRRAREFVETLNWHSLREEYLRILIGPLLGDI
jgi:L-malate glycosyltransferase